jgi:hypothetical protein
MRSILDRSFRYTPSFDTDVRRTFDRIRRERRELRAIRLGAGASSVTGASGGADRRPVAREAIQPARMVAQAAG